MKKSYVVCVNSPSDWPEIHNLLLLDGTLEDNIPSRACECVDEKVVYKDKATYLLDEEEVELISQNKKVKYVELDPSVHPEAYPPSLPFEQRFNQNVKIYRTISSLALAANPPTAAATIDELNRTSYCLKRLEQKERTWRDSDFVRNTTGSLFADHLNRNYAGLPKVINTSYYTNQTGRYVDCVVIDNGAWHGHPEFVDSSGISQIKDLVLDGPFYIDPDYFTTNSKTTTFLGRTTCTEAAAIEWWTDTTKRSASFSSAPVVSSSSIPIAYTRANMCGSYSAYPSHSSVEADFANHGTGVASNVYGKTFGWAFEANKWNVAANVGQSTVISVEKIYEILKIFVDNKPTVSGIKYPTTINSSYGTVASVASEFSTGTYYYKFRDENFGIFTDKSEAPGFLKNFTGTENSYYSVATSSTTAQDAGDTLANTEGVIWITSAGNYNQNQVNPDELDYNNYWSTVDPEGGSFDPAVHANYVNRRGTPANFGYNSTTGSYKVISVGALSGYLNEQFKENKDWYSNSGTSVDVFAPASGVLSAAGNSNQQIYPRYDSQSYYSWLSKDAYDTPVSGTSTASPVFAGFIASKLSDLYYWGADQVRKYIENVIDNQSPFEFETGAGVITSSDSPNWDSLDNLFGKDPKIAYNELVPSITFSQNLPSITEIDADTDNAIFSVTLPPISGDIYTYQWESSPDDTQNFSPISGATSRFYIIKNVDSSAVNKFYRVKVSSTGAFRTTYSVASYLRFTPDTPGEDIGAPTLTLISILSQPQDVIAKAGNSVTLSITAVTSSFNSNITYQWQKFSPLSEAYVDVPGAIFPELTFDNALSANSGEYRCILNDGISETVVSDSAEIDIPPSLVNFITQPRSIESTIGSTIELEAEARSSSNSAIKLQWQFNPESSDFNDSNWSDIEGASEPTLTILNSTSSNAGYYRCKATDGVSVNSPLFSAFALVTLEDVVLTITQAARNISLLEGRELFFSVQATLNDGRRPLFRFEKRNVRIINAVDLVEGVECKIETVGNTDFIAIGASNNNVGTNFTATGPGLGNGTVRKINWELVTINTTGRLDIQKILLADDGRYRCIVEDYLAINSPRTVSPIVLDVTPSFEVTNITSSPAVATIDNEMALTPTISIFNRDLAYYYVWERKENGTTEWKTIDGAQDKVYKFIVTGRDYLDRFRCRVINSLNTVLYTSPDFQISFNPFVDVVKELQKTINFKTNSQQTHTLEPEIVSTHSSTLSYVWQKSLDYVITNGQIVPSTWTDLTTETNSNISLTPAKILSLNSGNTDDFYFVRLKINFGHNSSYIFSEPTRVDLKDVINLFGNCLTKENVDNLYNTDLRDSREPHGIESLPDRQYLEAINVDPIGPKDKCKDKNTCGITVQELFERYSLYDPQRGLYRSWGDIIFPWDIDVSVRSNLNYSLTDDKWKIAKYAAVYAYFEGDRVLYIEDDGYKICLYEANQDVLAIAGPLDKTKWNQICCIELSEPFGLPTLEELEERCHYYNLEFFWTKWKNYSGEWEDNLFEQAINTCNTAGVSTAEFIERLKEKESEYECTSDKSSDRWKEARIRKGNFYERGDCILVKGVCEDTVCVFLAHTNMPATDENYKKYKNFLDSPWENYFQRLYCLQTGKNKCLEPQRKRDLPNYQLVEIGSLGHYVEQPIPFYELKGDYVCEQNNAETLNERVEYVEPTILTDAQIDEIDPPVV